MRQPSPAFNPLTSSQLPTKGGEMLEAKEIRPVKEGEFRPLPINQTQFRPRWALFRVSLILQRRFIRRGDFREQFEPDKVLP